MAKDGTKIKMRACDVTFNAVDLGHTQGGVEIEYKPKYKEITADKFGETPIDKVLVGEALTVKCKLAETSFEVLKAAIAAGTLETDSTDNMLKIGKGAGFRASSVAYALLLHPTDMAAETDNDFTVYKAVCVEGVKIAHEVDKEAVYEVTFEALVDESKEDGNVLAHYGNTIV